jgi:hypothetical protein
MAFNITAETNKKLDYNKIHIEVSAPAGHLHPNATLQGDDVAVIIGLIEENL